MLLIDSTVLLAYQKDRMYSATRVTVLNQVLTEKSLRLHSKKIQFTRAFFFMKNEKRWVSTIGFKLPSVSPLGGFLLTSSHSNIVLQFDL